MDFYYSEFIVGLQHLIFSFNLYFAISGFLWLKNQ